jgi:adenylate cyclase
MKKILIIDDEREFVEFLTIRLEASGYEVVSAFDGKEGFEKARSEKPDLIILDLGLPKVDGLWVCDLLKKDTKFAGIPVIVLTARGDAHNEEIARECGAEVFLIKPFEPERLLQEIRSLLR